MESLWHGQSQVIPETGFDALWGSAAPNSLGPDRARSRPRRRRAIRPRGLPGGLARYGVKNVRFHGEGRIVRRQAGDFATEAFSPGGEPRIRGDTMDEVGGGLPRRVSLLPLRPWDRSLRAHYSSWPAPPNTDPVSRRPRRGCVARGGSRVLPRVLLRVLLRVLGARVSDGCGGWVC